MSIAKTAIIGKNVTIRPGAVIEDYVTVGDGCFLDYNVILREHVTLAENCFVGANSILGEYLSDFYPNHACSPHRLVIGENALIRSGCILYGESTIGRDFSTGHRVTIREHTDIGDHVSVGTLCDIQGFCQIGNWTRLHSNVHIGQKSRIGSFCWLYPYVVLTNDPTPPSEILCGVTVQDFAVICTGSVILPGLVLGSDSLVGAGCVVTKDVPPEAVVIGNPGKIHGSVLDIKNPQTGKPVYPWRQTFRRGMPWQESDYDAWADEMQAAINKLDQVKK